MQIFATRVWGFDPERWPVVIFGRAGDRDSLIRRSQAGDRIVLVATSDTKKVEPENRGRLLGIAEFGRSLIRTEDFVRREYMSPHDLDRMGQVKWRYALPITRAWRFSAKPLILNVLRKQLPYNATFQAVLLDDMDSASVLALFMEEVELSLSEGMQRARALVDGLVHSGPTTGPAPSSAAYTVSRDIQRPAFTYCLRFGRRDIWKVGWTIDIQHRLQEINLHVPSEVLHEAWTVELQQPWPSQTGAQAMEQRVLKELTRFRTQGERLRCTSRELMAAWARAFG